MTHRVAAALLLGLSAGSVAASDEFRVNAFTTSYQFLGSAAFDSSGGFVIVWSSSLEDGYGSGVFAQRFAAGGAPVGAEFRVNQETTGSQTAARIAFLPGDQFVVVWVDDRAGDGDVKARRFDAAGAAVTPDFRVNTHTSGGQLDPHVAASSGGFVVVWDTVNLPGGDILDVVAQRFAVTGEPLGAEFRVNAYTTAQQTRPTIGMDAGGDFVVAWTSYGQDGASSVYAQRYASAGQPLAGETRINTSTTVASNEASVSVAATGDFVVAWRAGNSVFARRFGANGAPEGFDFLVAAPADTVSLPAVGGDPTGEFVVTWRQTGLTSDVFAQRFGRAGAPIASPFRVNSYTTAAQTPRDVEMDASGGFVVVFDSYGLDGSLDGVFARRFEALVSGDVDGNGVVDVSDVFRIINFLFAAGPPLLGEGDVNGDRLVSVADVFYLINFLFAGGAAPV